jgi:hypothetical protein
MNRAPTMFIDHAREEAERGSSLLLRALLLYAVRHATVLGTLTLDAVRNAARENGILA